MAGHLQENFMASAINPLTGSSNTNTGSGSTPGVGGAPPSEEMFLQLLVSQLQNQDPLNPADSTQFVAELAQFSQLEQVIAIRGDIETQIAAGASGAATNGTTGNGSSPAGNTNNTGQTPATNSIKS
jgi:flagellar basal-body rod modification protein FlgD